MTEITAALWEFWSQFELDGQPVPVYQSGVVPRDAVYPYFTIETPQADAFRQLPLAAMLWCRHDGVNTAPALAQRMAIGDAVARVIAPVVGVRVNLPHGLLMVYRGSGDFLAPLTDEDDPQVIGLRIGYETTYYTA